MQCACVLTSGREAVERGGDPELLLPGDVDVSSAD